MDFTPTSYSRGTRSIPSLSAGCGGLPLTQLVEKMRVVWAQEVHHRSHNGTVVERVLNQFILYTFSLSVTS